MQFPPPAAPPSNLHLPEHDLLAIARLHYGEQEHWLYGPDHKRHRGLTELFLGHLRVADHYHAQVTYTEEQSVRFNYIASARMLATHSRYTWRYLHHLRSDLPQALESEGVTLAWRSRGGPGSTKADAYYLTFRRKPSSPYYLPSTPRPQMEDS